MMNAGALLEHLGADTEQAFRGHYDDSVNRALVRNDLAPDSKYTESLAVGSEEFVRGIGGSIRNRMNVEVIEDDRGDSSWILREQRTEASASG